MAEGVSEIPVEGQEVQKKGGFLNRFRRAGSNNPQLRSKTEQTQKSEISPNVKKFSQFLYRSFDFSQGSQYLQTKMFEYIHLTNPNLTLSEEELVEVKKKVHDDMMERFFLGKSAGTGAPIDSSHSKDITLKTMKDALSKNVDLLHRIFTNNSKVSSGDEKQLLEEITTQIISLDNKYLSRTDGRPRKQTPNSSGHEHTNNFRSYLRYYAGEQKRIELPEFASLFRAVRGNFIERIDQGNLTIDHTLGVLSPETTTVDFDPSVSLSSLVNRWEETHPGQKFMDVFETQSQDLPVAAD